MGKKKKKPSSKKVLDYCPNIDNCSDKNCESCDTLYLQYFVKHPPDGFFSPEELEKMSLFVGEHEIKNIKNENEVELPASLYIISKTRQFKETKNPVYAIEAFLVAHKAGVYPPLSILNFLADKFEKYHSTFGEVSLDSLLGFKTYRGKKAPPFKAVMNEERNEKLTLDVFRLNLLGYTIPRASIMVYEKLEATPKWDKTGLKLKAISQTTIQDLFKNKWKDIFNNDTSKKATLKWLKTNKENFLKSFPQDSLKFKPTKKPAI